MLSKGAPALVGRSRPAARDFVAADHLYELLEKMNQLTDEPLLDPVVIRAQILAGIYRSPTRTPKTHRCKVSGIRAATSGDRIARTASPHRILDPEAGPLIGVKLHVLTRKTLGGIQTDLDSRALGRTGSRSRDSMPPVRSPALAVVGCMGTTPWRERSWAAACSPVAPPADMRPAESSDPHPRRPTGNRCRPGGTGPIWS